MFVQALEQISKKISKSNQKEQGYKILERKIFKSPNLKSQFEIFCDLKENSKKISSKNKFKVFFESLKEKTKNIDPKVNSEEVKKLLEYFNIDPNTIKETIMDKAVLLNENAVRSIVIDTKKELLAESFKRIIKKEDENELRKNFQVLNFLSESFSDKKRKSFFKESLRSLLEERYKDYNSCVKKLYKLRVLAENLIREAWDDDEETKSEFGGGKKVRIKDMNYVKDISIQVPEMWKKPQKIIISFYIPIYPIGATMSASTTSAIKVRERLNRIERPFINSTIYNKNRTDLFDPIGTIWQVGLKMQSKPGSKQYAGIDIYLNTNKEKDGINTWEMLYKSAAEIVKDFNEMLPILLGDLSDTLTPEAQKDSIKAAKGLSKSEKMAAAQKNGEVDRDLIKKKIGSQDADEAETRVDDFAGAF